MNQILAYCRELIRGRRNLQKFFLFLYKTSLVGMNFSGGAVVKTSGEAGVIDYVSEKLPLAKPLIIFDVGAHVGDYSQMLLDRLNGRTTIIHAFEPSAVTFKKLRENIKSQDIFLHPFGLSDTAKTMSLFYDYETSVYASIYQRNLEHSNIFLKLSETITLKTLDAFCKEQNINHIHFLKMDIEGHEFSALQGAKEMLRHSIDFIQFEFSAANIDSRTFFKDFYYLLKDQYVIYRVLRDGLFRLDTYNETQEIYFTTNYLAQRKHA